MYEIFAKLFATIGIFRFRDNFREKFTRFSRKSGIFCFCENFREKCRFSRKSAFSVFAKNIRDYRENFREKLSRNFAKICQFSHDFRENGKMHFRFNPNAKYGSQEFNPIRFLCRSETLQLSREQTIFLNFFKYVINLTMS
jgi:hypothetical protein